MIYTTNYATLRWKKELLKGKPKVAISVVVPDFMEDTAPMLTPNWSLVKALKEGKITEEEFKERYLKKVERKIEEMGGLEVFKEVFDENVLVCFCGKNKFCHRHILREWLNEHGIPCKEI